MSNWLANAFQQNGIEAGDHVLFYLLNSIELVMSIFAARKANAFFSVVDYANTFSWADQQITLQNSINYYNSVVSSMGGEATTQEFIRLFMVPGMMHCETGRGSGMDSRTLAVVQQWVEEGITTMGIKSPAGSRPLYAYPQVARYTGMSSSGNAKVFVCETP
jgi:hypothetical protein